MENPRGGVVDDMAGLAPESWIGRPFDGLPAHGHIVVFDLEYTAWEGSLARNWSGPGEYREVVQIGAVKLAVEDDLREIACFDVLTLPRFNPMLSDYFTALTGITNDMLSAGGRPFAECFAEFAGFVGDAGSVYCNGNDFLGLNQNTGWNGLTWPFRPGLFCNLRGAFAEALGVTRIDAVSSRLPGYLGLVMEGEAHTGLGDARAIASAIRELRRRGKF